MNLCVLKSLFNSNQLTLELLYMPLEFRFSFQGIKIEFSKKNADSCKISIIITHKRSLEDPKVNNKHFTGNISHGTALKRQSLSRECIRKRPIPHAFFLYTTQQRVSSSADFSKQNTLTTLPYLKISWLLQLI